MSNKLLFWGAVATAFFAPLAHSSSITVGLGSNTTFSGPAPTNMSLLTGDNSFTATFTPGTGNSNVSPNLTFYGTPGVLTSQGSALGEFTFSESPTVGNSHYGPVTVEMNVTVGSASTTLDFEGTLAEVGGSNGSGGVLNIDFAPTGNQTAESLLVNSTSEAYVVQYFDGYAFGVLETTEADQGTVDTKNVAIDGFSSAAPEPGSVFTLGLAGAGLFFIGFKKRAPKKQE